VGNLASRQGPSAIGMMAARTATGAILSCCCDCLKLSAPTVTTRPHVVPDLTPRPTVAARRLDATAASIKRAIPDATSSWVLKVGCNKHEARCGALQSLSYGFESQGQIATGDPGIHLLVQAIRNLAIRAQGWESRTMLIPARCRLGSVGSDT
jgi:hypothetical protein